MRHEFQEYSPTFYKPHTLKSLALLLLILYVLSQRDYLESLAESLSLTKGANQTTSSQDFKANGANLGVCFAFICVGSIHLPNTLMTRPHAVFWRAILACYILYSMFVTYLLLLPVDQARQTLRIFDDNLGKPLPERSYGDDCRLFTPEHPTSYMANFSSAVFDVHFIAHFVGWWGKMMIMRDWYVAWACSIGFEICELTFRHWLPNFYECWWDHLFLDLFGCNLIGIILGHYTLKYFGSKRIQWVWDSKAAKNQARAVTQTENCGGQLITALDKLRPAVLEKYEWAALANLQHFFGVLAYICTILLIDCNNFFMKFVLWVPAEHDLLKYRVVLLGICSLATSKEWYEYISNEYCHRLGPFAWLSFYSSAVELLCVIKCSEGKFTAPFPLFVMVIWACLALAFIWLFAIAYANTRREAELKKTRPEFNPYNPDLEIVNHASKKTN